MGGSPENPLEYIQIDVVSIFGTAISESGEIEVEEKVIVGKPHLRSEDGGIVCSGCEPGGQPHIVQVVGQPGINIIGRVGSVFAEENVIVSFYDCWKDCFKKASCHAHWH